MFHQPLGLELRLTSADQANGLNDHDNHHHDILCRSQTTSHMVWDGQYSKLDKQATGRQNNGRHSHCCPSSSLVIAKQRCSTPSRGTVVTVAGPNRTSNCLRNSTSNHHRHFHRPRRLISQRTTVSNQTHSAMFKIMFTLMVLIALARSPLSCALDSPVKVQRQKQLQQQQFQTNTTTSRTQQISSELSLGEPQVGSNVKIDRVRRTNSEQQAPTRSNQQRDCPSQRLIQGLLPPEYVGSPATSQRPSMARAHCECLADPLGWHLTCYAGSMAGANLNQQIGSGGRASGSPAPPMPNQLHPAFRSSQVARQQQVAAAAGRRSKRLAPIEMMGADDAPASVGHEPDESSPHEGFGEEQPNSGNHQRPSVNDGGQMRPVSLQRQRDARAQLKVNQQEAQHSRQESSDQAKSSFSTSIDQLAREASSVHSQQLTFQPVPVLFGVKYLRNNMIEIDCDQSVPNYKAAMFRGFNVNEISSFTFNNCQLPNIPFSVLLHRTRTAADSQQTANQSGGGAPKPPGPQALKPTNRRQQFNGPLTRRRRDESGRSEAEAEEEDKEKGEEEEKLGTSSVRSAGQMSAIPSAAQQSSGEPKVKSLTINLNAIVEQRTLITLLTGLDLLEELQLNYMQLNLANFINELQQIAPTTTTTTTTTTGSTISSSAASSTLAPSSSSPTPPSNLTSVPSADELTLAASANVDFGHSPSVRVTGTPTQVAASPPVSAATGQQLTSRLSSPMTSVATTSTTSTTTSTTTTTTTTPPPPPLTTQMANNNNNNQRQQPTSRRQQSSATTTPTATTVPIPINARPSSLSTSSSSAIATSLLGAPRGLAVAQATGQPPTTISSTTPLTTTSRTASTTSSMVPSVPLSTVISSVSSSSISTSSTSNSQDQPQTTMTTQTAKPQAATNNQRQLQQQNGGQLISIGVSQAQSVSYSGPSPSASSRPARPQSSTMFHLATSGGAAGSGQPATSTSAQVTTTTGNNNNQLLTPNRLHSSPSPWMAPATRPTQTTTTTSLTTSNINQPAAGSRLSMSPTGQTSGDLLIAGTSSVAPSTPPSWSAVSATGTPFTTTPLNSPSNGLSAPANTPPFNTNTAPQSTQSNGLYGSRTGSSNAPFNQSMRMATVANTLQQGRRQFATTTINSQPDESQNFVAAGLRLMSSQQPNRAHQFAFNQRRNQQQQQSSANQPPTTSGSRFVTSSSSSSSSGSFETSSNSGALPDEHQFVAPQDESHEQRPRATSGPTETSRRSVNRNRNRSQDDDERGELDENDQDADESAHSTTPNLERISRSGRTKRAVASDEFELSFGDLLPNLRSLKLESFIDLSPLVANLGQQPQANKRRVGQLQQQQQNSGGGSIRFRRDANSAAKVTAEPDSETDSEGRDDGPDVEPGETLWRSASGRASFFSGDELRDSDVAHVSVAAPPPHMTPTSGNHNQHHQLPAGLDQTELSWSESQLQQRQRQFSSLVLNRLFSHLTKLQVLHLTSNEIPFWPDHVLQDSRQTLTRLYLISNNIRQVSRNSFVGLANLRALDLSSNQLRHLEGDLFRDLLELRQLRACRNLFRKLPLKLFMKQAAAAGASNEANKSSSLALAKLESVDLSKNKYLAEFQLEQTMKPNQLSNSLGPITSLNLSDCALSDQLVTFGNQTSSSANQILFAALSELTNLSLRNNKFKDLLQTANLFAKNRQLKSVDLSHNQLERLNRQLFNGNASQIQELKLQHNKLIELPDQFLFNLRKLRSLNLAHNKLNQLNGKSFLTNQLLESLDLSFNQLTTLNTHQSDQIPFGNGANLRQLNLSHNNLTDFGSDVFDIAWSFYAQLQVFNLAHNKFSGQIQMPIFYTITDEMALSLASNRIQSVSVEALVQHEQVLERYATSFESLSAGPTARADRDSAPDDQQQQQHSSSGQSRNSPPTVSIKLANNPLACDCLLEPLVSYTRRVAAATNPALVASIFQNVGQQQQPNGPRANGANEQHANGLVSGSKYSFATNSNGQHQPQVLYQFRFSDAHCDRPRNLQRRPLSHVSIGDLLCPIQDERLCPRQCECHYQSAFRTVIVDCSGRQLARVPHQLSDAANFNQFEVLTTFNLSQHSTGQDHHQADGGSDRMQISQVDKMIIRLDNNQLESVDELANLFRVVAIQPQATPSAAHRAASGESSGSSARHSEANLRVARDISLRDYETGSETPPTAATRNKKISPVAMARMQQLKQEQQQRQTRQVVEVSSTNSPYPASDNDEHEDHRQANFGADSVDHNHHQLDNRPTDGSGGGGGGGSGTTNFELDSATAGTLQPMSTAVLESAEEFRNGRYPHKTCELYLDHNNLDSLPETFLAQLDRIQMRLLQTSQTPPQAALPSAMLEPPLHTKLNSLNVAADSGASHQMAPGSNSAAAANDPMKASASSLQGTIWEEAAPSSSPSLFGRQSFVAEKKAALMESVQQSVRLNKLQQQQQQQDQTDQKRLKFTVSPSLVVLSLRYNNFANLKPKTLLRLGKLIKSSGTRLYFGHNPFNCSDNFLQDSNDNSTTSSTANLTAAELKFEGGDLDEVTSPLGDQLIAASDSQTGAYLATAPDDLTPAASGETGLGSNSIENAAGGSGRATDLLLQQQQQQQLGANEQNQPLTPVDCPVGQLKTWLTRYHSHVGDLDELYCVHMPVELAEKLKLQNVAFNSTSDFDSSSGGGGGDQLDSSDSSASNSQKMRRQVSSLSLPMAESKREHDHPWTSSLNAPALVAGAGSGSNDQSARVNFVNTSQLHKNGISWNADLLMVSAKLIDLDLYDLCPYSNIQLLDSASLGYLSAGHQRLLISVAVVFILISLCLLMMLIYFGDTQTILAFVYIHLNPVYNCLHLNESHLDGEKLYDAFVSYSSADRDIVMELIEHLEQPPDLNSANGNNKRHSYDQFGLLTDSDGKGTTLERSRDVLVTEDDLRPGLLLTAASSNGNLSGANSQQQQTLSTLQRRSTSTLLNSSQSSSFQDLSTMSRSTSRILNDSTGGDFGGGISSSPAPRSEQNNNSQQQFQLGLGASSQQQQQQMHQLNTNRPYRLCIHERDWLPGHLISWNIVNSVQNSRRTILILSKEFIKSVWFQVEFHTAYYQMLEDKIDRLIVIVRGDLPPKHELDKNLAFLLTTKTYLTWGEKWFWERLHYALPHRAGPPPPLAVGNKMRKEAKVQAKPAKANKLTSTTAGQQSAKLSGSAAGLLSSLAAGHADPLPRHHQQQKQQPLLMSNIGKDCSRLLLTNSSSPTASNRNNSSSSSSATSSGSTTSGSNQTLAAGQQTNSSAHFINQLFKTDSQDQMMTTSNDLLSSPISARPGGGPNTTRLSVGSTSVGMRSSSPLQSDSGDQEQRRPMSSNVTSIMLDGAGASNGPNSRVRSKKQEKLQSFVDKEISNRFNLSEL